MIFADATVLDQSSPLVQAFTLISPAVVAFLVGHFHVIPGTAPKPVVPPTPAPVDPNSVHLLPIGQGGILQALGLFANSVPSTTPGQINAIGKGGLLQLIGLAITGVMASPNGTPEQKSAAASQIVNATAPFLQETPAAPKA